MSSKIIVCSAIVNPARKYVFKYAKTWLDQVRDILVHTFAMREDCFFEKEVDLKGYWYCAGDYCAPDEAGVYQDIVDANLDYVECLVKPGIKDDHKDRDELVISGEYGIHYVCHNITNRVLYACENVSTTIIDLDIKQTGYELVVKSCLGVYGQNLSEWGRRKNRCKTRRALINQGGDSVLIDRMISDRKRDHEIDKIHARATNGDKMKAITA